VSGGFGRSDTFFVGLNVNWVVDCFGLINKSRAAWETFEAARANLATSELNAIADVVNNYVSFKESVWLYDKATAQSKAAAKAITLTSSTEDKNYLDAINAQKDLFTARTLQAQGAIGVYMSAYGLANSVGIALRILEMDHNLNVPAVNYVNQKSAIGVDQLAPIPIHDYPPQAKPAKSN
jgi:outer membrane protein TolC